MAEKFFSFLWRLIRNGHVVAAVLIVAIVAAIYAATPAVYDKYISPRLAAASAKEPPEPVAKEPDLFKSTVYLWTYDSSDNSVQHKEISLEGSNTLHGKYTYRESGNHGLIVGYRRIEGTTIGLEYVSDDPEGDGLGYITLRRLKNPIEATPPIWIGFETGHDCLCGSNVPHEGPFTSVPAILTTTPEPPEYLVELVKRAKTQKEDFVWPPEVAEKAKKS